jgi:glyoxylase-like metal-dependent hydrolase (beta-lactamase superfamily II)
MRHIDTTTITRKAGWLLLAATCVLAPGRPALAQSQDAGARIERVADGVYAIIHDRATEDWTHGNTGVVVGDDGVLVVDATYLPSRARADIALIRTVTDKPVRYLVLTHQHRDHNGGTSAYRDAFPNVIVVSGADTREFIAINRAATARADAAPTSQPRKKLAALEARLASGMDSTGVALTAADRSALERNVRERRVELNDLSSLRVIVPDVTVGQELDVHLGGRRVEIRNEGRAHSPEDLTVYVPGARVLFSGDIVVCGPLFYGGTSWPIEWARTLRTIESSEAAVIVPGHGLVMHDLAYTKALRALVESVNAQVATMLSQGLPLDQMQQRVDVTQLRAAVPDWRGAERDADWARSINALVDRSWHALRGLT